MHVRNTARRRPLGFTRAQLEAHRDKEVADLVGETEQGAPRLVFVGVNPGLWSAATGTHFAHPSNRFYPALHRAGITSRALPRGVEHTAVDRRELTGRGVAVTNLVARATARASELSPDELRDGGRALRARLEAWRPRVVAFAGVTAYRTAFVRPGVRTGPQRERLADAELWVVPNPSGLNAHETVESLATWYRRVGEAAGVVQPWSAPTRGASGDRRPRRSG